MAFVALVPFFADLASFAREGGLIHLTLAEGTRHPKDDSVADPAKLNICKSFRKRGKISNITKNVPRAGAKDALRFICVCGRRVLIIDVAAL